MPLSPSGSGATSTLPGTPSPTTPTGGLGSFGPTSTTATPGITPGGTPGFIGGTPFPGATGSTPGASAPPATGAPASGGAPAFSSTDPAAVDAWLAYEGAQPGIDPSVRSDPGYWKSKILSGELGPDAGYIVGKMTTAQQGAPGGGGGAGGFGGAGGLGAFLAPYTGTFTAPTGTDDPGFQFALQQGQDAMSRGAAATGNLQTGGFAKDLASYTTGAALQDYAGAYNRAANTFNTNYNVFRNNQTDPYNKLMGAAGLGYGAAAQTGAYGSQYGSDLTGLAGSYGTSLTGLTTGAGNVGAAGSIGTGNALNSGLGAFGQWYQQTYGVPYSGAGY